MCWVKYDAGEGHRARPAAEVGDCTVRALAVARAMSYGQAWQQLYAIQGEDAATAFDLPRWLCTYPDRFGVLAARGLSFPALRRQPRMTAMTFCRIYPTGRFILQMAHHVAAVVDGQLFDTWNSSSRCGYRAWEVAPAAVAVA
jgi:hypothetical protein